jgi:DNA-binding beta-propeller fold protein YncE
LRVVFVFATAALFTGVRAAYAGDKGILELAGTIPIEGVGGRIDHMATSADGRKLFVAALASDMVEEINTERRRVIATVRGIKEPQGVYYIARSKKLVVASGGDGNVRIYDQDLKLVGTVESLEDADNVRYDSGNNLLYVGYGRGALAIIDPDKGVKVGNIPLDGHPESFQLEHIGARIFVNVPTVGEVEVIDREKRLLLTRWKLTAAAANFPMALDEADQRLFIGCRTPAQLLALNATSGEVVAKARACGDTDDLFYDSVNRMIYMSGGAGCVSVVDRANSNSLDSLGTIATAWGARTSLFEPSSRTLYVAVPHRGSQGAKVLIFKTMTKF